jgi:hypothetical protein
MLLVLIKRLIEKIAEKMHWDIFVFKMNLYLRYKFALPLTSRAGDSPIRQAFAYLIIFFVFAIVTLTMLVSVGSRLAINSNIDLISNALKNRFAVASQMVGENNYVEKNNGKYIATLPMADQVEQSPGFDGLNYPAKR